MQKTEFDYIDAFIDQGDDVKMKILVDTLYIVVYVKRMHDVQNEGRGTVKLCDRCMLLSVLACIAAREFWRVFFAYIMYTRRTPSSSSLRTMPSQYSPDDEGVAKGRFLLGQEFLRDPKIRFSSIRCNWLFYCTSVNLWIFENVKWQENEKSQFILTSK